MIDFLKKEPKKEPKKEIKTPGPADNLVWCVLVVDDDPEVHV